MTKNTVINVQKVPQKHLKNTIIFIGVGLYADTTFFCLYSFFFVIDSLTPLRWCLQVVSDLFLHLCSSALFPPGGLVLPPPPLLAVSLGAVMLPNGPADMCSVVQITLRDIFFVCLGDGCL